MVTHSSIRGLGNPIRADILERKEEILSWIDEELTLFEIKTRLGCKYETLRHYLKKMGIVYKGQQNRKGQFKGKYMYRCGLRCARFLCPSLSP